jgi:hypothetical protein
VLVLLSLLNWELDEARRIGRVPDRIWSEVLLRRNNRVACGFLSIEGTFACGIAGAGLSFHCILSKASDYEPTLSKIP